MWTGSYNYTISALLDNDGVLLKLWNHGAIDAFQSNFQTLAAQSYQTTQAGSCSP